MTDLEIKLEVLQTIAVTKEIQNFNLTEENKRLRKRNQALGDRCWFYFKMMKCYKGLAGF